MGEMTDPIRPEAADVGTSGANAAVTLTYAADPVGAHVITDVLVSYSPAPAGGLLTVKRAAVTVRECHISTAGPDHIRFTPPIMGLKNEAVSVTLAAGGGTAVGKVNAGHYVKGTP